MKKFILKSYACTGTLGTLNTTNITAPKDRGDAKGFYLIVPSGTIADTGVTLITVAINGFNVIEQVPAIQFATQFQSGNKFFIPQNIPDASTLVVTVDATLSAGAVPTFLELVYQKCEE